jgi:peptide/nickel transport system ATP-binding protein
VVVADEPTTALDVTVQAQVLKLIRSLRDERGVAFLFVTHDLAVASAIADRLLVLYGGRIVEIGPTASVTRKAAHPYTVALLKARFGIDVDRSRALPTIPGDPPQADQTLTGCSFAPRCVLVEPVCREIQPPLEAIAQHSGLAACHRSAAVSSDIWDSGATEWPDRAPRGPANVLVEIDVVTKSFSRSRFGGRAKAQTLALDHVSLQIKEGESVALVGESGSGKTTLLRLVAGLTTPDTGSVRFAVEDQPQMVYQDAYASLTPWLTAGDLIGERLRRQHLSRPEYRAQVEAALKRVGLHAGIADMRPPNLSGGQRQRVALARAIVVPPRLLLCDEPISAVDVSMGAAMLNLLQQLRLRLQMAMLFVTHDIAAARFIADRIIVMKDGQIVDAGESDVVTHDPEHLYTRQLLAALPAPVV